MEILILSGMLGLYSIEDIRKRTITAKYLIVFGIAGVMIHLCKRDISLLGLLLGAGVGMGMVCISFITRGRVGMGDGLLLITTGIFLGGAVNMELLMISLVYASFYSLGVIIFRKKKKNCEIPFIPFIFAGYITIVVGGSL